MQKMQLRLQLRTTGQRMISLKTFLEEKKNWEQLIFDSVIEFLNNKYNTSYKITVVVKKKMGETFGHVNLLGKNNKIVIQSAGTDYMVSSIIHEFIHIKQINTKEIGVSKDKKYITWNGILHIPVDTYKELSTKSYDKYKVLPWESEAITAAKSLRDKYFKSPQFTGLRGKDPTLDIVLDNH